MSTVTLSPNCEKYAPTKEKYNFPLLELYVQIQVSLPFICYHIELSTLEGRKTWVPHFLLSNLTSNYVNTRENLISD